MRPKHLKKAIVLRDYCPVSHQTWKDLMWCPLIIDSTALCVVLHTVHRNFQKVQLLVNAFGVFREFYRGHFSPDFRAQGVTLKSKALAAKCIFQIYSQLLDIFTQLVLKTADELILRIVCGFFVTTEHQRPLSIN